MVLFRLLSSSRLPRLPRLRRARPFSSSSPPVVVVGPIFAPSFTFPVPSDKVEYYDAVLSLPDISALVRPSSPSRPDAAVMECERCLEVFGGVGGMHGEAAKRLRGKAEEYAGRFEGVGGERGRVLRGEFAGEEAEDVLGRGLGLNGGNGRMLLGGGTLREEGEGLVGPLEHQSTYSQVMEALDGKSGDPADVQRAMSLASSALDDLAPSGIPDHVRPRLLAALGECVREGGEAIKAEALLRTAVEECESCQGTTVEAALVRHYALSRHAEVLASWPKRASEAEGVKACAEDVLGRLGKGWREVVERFGPARAAGVELWGVGEGRGEQEVEENPTP